MKTPVKHSLDSFIVSCVIYICLTSISVLIISVYLESLISLDIYLDIHQLLINKLMTDPQGLQPIPEKLVTVLLSLYT